MSNNKINIFYLRKDVTLIFSILSLLLYSCSNQDEAMEDPSIYVASIQISGEDITNGGTSQMSVSIFPDDATDTSVIWEVSDESVASISSNGLLTAIANGEVTVTAIASDRGIVSSSKRIEISGLGDYLVSNTQELLDAIFSVEAGETILINEGNYQIDNRIVINTSGTSQARINLLAVAGSGRPRFDFSSMSENSSNQGIRLNGDYWYIKGIDFYKAGDNGMQIKGSNNMVEFCTFSECSDTGLQLDDGASNNTILNCDSFYNADSTQENADGFAAKLSVGTGNKFIGCRAWQNLDDGWDGYLRGVDNVQTTYENCWAIKNGYLQDGTAGNGDGNGFKTGGSDSKDLKHNAIFTNCLAIDNIVDGFDHNSNRGSIEIYNCSAYKNGRNIGFGTSDRAGSLIIKNTLSFLGDSSDSFSATQTDITNNGWQDGLVTNTLDFISIDESLLTSPRNADGSLPNIDFLKLISTSDLIDKGISVGLPFNGSAPDIGAFESD